MTAEALVERIFDYVESREIDKAVIACLRLARLGNDFVNAVMFLRELYPDRRQLQEAFYDETRTLREEARDLIWKTTQDRWIEERTMEFSLSSKGDENNVLAVGVGELAREIVQLEKSIDDLALPSGMGEYDLAAFTDRHANYKGQLRLRIRASESILERVRTRCLNYATRVERELKLACEASDFMNATQQDVHNFYSERCPSVCDKLKKAASLIGSSNPEDHALLLTSIRRAVKEVADFHFPPQSEPRSCHDGKKRVLDEEKYLNRLQEFCYTGLQSTASDGLIRAELEYLSVFIRRLHEVTSKGVHASVSGPEAKQGLLGIYMFLSNLIAKLQLSQSNSDA